MSNTRLPLYIDPIKFAEQRRSLAGPFSLKGLKRLKEKSIEEAFLQEGELFLESGVDVQGLKYLKGNITAKIPAYCQRCFGLMYTDIKTTFCLSPVRNEEEAKELPSVYEPLFLDEQKISLYDMIEDELLLALPLVAKHDEQTCQLPKQWSLNKDAQSLNNPFDRLIQFKKEVKNGSSEE